MTTPDERPDLPPLDQTPNPPPAAPEAPLPSTGTPPPAPETLLPPAATPPPAPETPPWQRFDERAQALGHEAEAAVARIGSNPAVRETADLATRLWGLVLLAFGLWFFADVTLKMDLPAIAWGDLWPAVLIVLGGLVLLRGLARRR